MSCYTMSDTPIFTKMCRELSSFPLVRNERNHRLKFEDSKKLFAQRQGKMEKYLKVSCCFFLSNENIS